MYKLCKTEQSALRQRQLETGLLQVMEKTRYEDISISELCAQIGIPRKTFYRYFSSKDGALHALLDHTLMEFEMYNPPFLQGKRTLLTDLERFFHFWKQQKPLLGALERSDLSGVLIQQALEYATSEVVFPGRFLPGESRRMQSHVVMFGVCGLLSMTLQWHHDGYKDTPRDLAVIAARLLTQPLFPDPNQLM